MLVYVYARLSSLSSIFYMSIYFPIVQASSLFQQLSLLMLILIVWTLLDTSGRIWMHLDAFGHIQTPFGCIWTLALSGLSFLIGATHFSRWTNFELQLHTRTSQLGFARSLNRLSTTQTLFTLQEIDVFSKIKLPHSLEKCKK